MGGWGDHLGQSACSTSTGNLSVISSTHIQSKMWWCAVEVETSRFQVHCLSILAKSVGSDLRETLSQKSRWMALEELQLRFISAFHLYMHK